MVTMNVSLPDKMKAWVEKQVATGRYANASDYIRSLVRSDEAKVAGATWLQGEIDAGRASGVSDKSLDEVMTSARRKALAAAKARDAAA